MRTSLAASIFLLVCATQPSAAQEAGRITVKAKNSVATRTCAISNPSQCRTLIDYYTLDVFFTNDGSGAILHRGKWDKFRIGNWKSLTRADGKPLKYVFQRSGTGYQVTDTRGWIGTISIQGNRCSLTVAIKNDKVTGTSKTLDGTCTVART